MERQNCGYYVAKKLYCNVINNAMERRKLNATEIKSYKCELKLPLYCPTGSVHHNTVGCVRTEGKPLGHLW